MISQLLYVSTAVHSIGSGTDLDILLESDERNRRENLTGFLMRGSTWFSQFLEGPRDGLERVFADIQKDPRHYGLTTWHNGPVAKRMFPDWVMGYVAMTEADPRMLYLRLRSSNVDMVQKGLLMREISDVLMARPTDVTDVDHGRFDDAHLVSVVPIRLD